MADETIRIVVQGEDRLSTPAQKASQALSGLQKAASATHGILGTLTSGVGGLVGGLGKIGLASLGVQALASAAQQAGSALGVGLAVEMENVEAKLIAFTKDGAQAKAILAQIRTEADKTPFAFQEMAAATAGLMPVARASGEELMDLVKTAEILAAANPAQGLEGAAFALREAAGGDFQSVVERFDLPRQYMNQLKEQGVPAIQAVRKAMTAMGYDADLVGNLAKTASGRWSTLKDTFDSIRTAASTQVLSALKDVMGELQGVLDQNMPALKAWATQVGGGIAGAIRSVLQLAPRVLDTFRSLTAYVGDLADIFRSGDVAGAIRRAFGDLAGLAASLGDSIGQQLSQVDWAGIFQTALGTATRLADELTELLAEQWGRINWPVVWQAAQDIAAGFGTKFSEVAGKVTGWLAYQWSQIDWPKVWQAVKDIGSGLQGQLETAWKAINWDAVWEAGGKFRAGLVKAIDDSAPEAKAAARRAGEQAGEQFTLGFAEKSGGGLGALYRWLTTPPDVKSTWGPTAKDIHDTLLPVAIVADYGDIGMQAALAFLRGAGSVPDEQFREAFQRGFAGAEDARVTADALANSMAEAFKEEHALGAQRFAQAVKETEPPVVDLTNLLRQLGPVGSDSFTMLETGAIAASNAIDQTRASANAAADSLAAAYKQEHFVGAERFAAMDQAAKKATSGVDAFTDSTKKAKTAYEALIDAIEGKIAAINVRRLEEQLKRLLNMPRPTNARAAEGYDLAVLNLQRDILRGRATVAEAGNPIKGAVVTPNLSLPGSTIKPAATVTSSGGVTVQGPLVSIASVNAPDQAAAQRAGQTISDAVVQGLALLAQGAGRAPGNASLALPGAAGAR